MNLFGQNSKETLAALLLMLFASLAYQAVAQPLILTNVVAPAGIDTHEGATNFYAPFGIDQFQRRFQQVYDSSLFASALPAEGGWVRHVRFRVDAYLGPAFFAVLLTNVTISLSTTPRSADSLSLVFDENLGSDQMIIRGPSTFLFSGGRVDLLFNADLAWLSTPFYYNPDAGNLLLDITSLGGNLPIYFDAVDVVGDGVSSLDGFRLGGPPPPTGVPRSLGLATEFFFEPIPEPSTVMLLGLALAGLGIKRYHAKRPKEDPWR